MHRVCCIQIIKRKDFIGPWNLTEMICRILLYRILCQEKPCWRPLSHDGWGKISLLLPCFQIESPRDFYFCGDILRLIYSIITNILISRFSRVFIIGQNILIGIFWRNTYVFRFILLLVKIGVEHTVISERGRVNV